MMMSTTYPSVAKEVHEDVNPNVTVLDFYFDHSTHQLYLSVGDEQWLNEDAYDYIKEHKPPLDEYQRNQLDTWSYFNL